MSQLNASRPISRRDLTKVIGASVATGLAGCIGNGDGGGGGGGNSNQSVIMWNNAFAGTRNNKWKNWFLETYKNNTGTKLSVPTYEYPTIRSKYLTGARTGNPDLVEGPPSTLTEYATAGLIDPIEDRAKKLEYFDGYLDNVIDAVTYEDKIHALPYSGNARALIYRKDIFNKHGLKPPKTAKEFLTVGRTIKAKEDITPFHNCTKTAGVRGFQEWISHMYQLVDHVFKPKGDSWKVGPSADQIGKVFDAFYYEPWASDNPIADPKELGTGWQVNDYGYVNGEYAMIECGPWLLGFTSGSGIDNSKKAKTILNEKTAVAHLPYPKSGSRDTFLATKIAMLNSYTKQKDLAWEALKLFTSPKSMRKERISKPGDQATPIHKDVKTTMSDEDWMPFQEVFKTGTPLSKVTWGPVYKAFYPIMQQVVYGKSDPYKAGKRFHKELKNLTNTI
jgi:ABC-type glycerol-3-phosphate transport system substrate-binding protein